MAHKIPLIDTHIHLFARPHLDKLSWMTPENKLYGDYRLEEYLTNKSDSFELKGIVFIECDVKTDLKSKNYQNGIEEYLWIERIIENNLLEGEGSAEGCGDLIKGIIPWAPIGNGAAELSKYVDKLREKSSGSTAFERIRGFRSLLQDKPPGTMLEPAFAEGLNWLAEHNYVFDLGIDLRSGGLWQFEEFLDLAQRTVNVTYIVNHLTKPDLSLTPEAFQESSKVAKWKTLLAKARDTNNKFYVKLSGGFSELPPEISDDIQKSAEHVIPWARFLLELFGKENFIWGSDWPVCNVNAGDSAWEKWTRITEIVFKELDLDGKDIYYTSALRAYNISM